MTEDASQRAPQHTLHAPKTLLLAPQPRTALDALAACMLHASLAALDALPGHRWLATDRIARAQALTTLDQMHMQPKQLARPVVVFNGYRGWWGPASTVRDGLRKATGSNDIVFVSYGNRGTIEHACADARRVIARHLGADYASGAMSFDAVGISMGGLIARVLSTRGATDDDEALLRTLRGGACLHIATLFTLATPHRGATMAKRIAPDPAAKAMVPGSPMLQALEAARTHPMGTHAPALVCFGQSRDAMVGLGNTAPKSARSIRARGPRVGSHFTSARNPVFWMHIARALRGEPDIVGQATTSCDAP